MLVGAFGEERVNQRLRDYSRLLSRLLLELTNADLLASTASGGATARNMQDQLQRQYQAQNLLHERRWHLLQAMQREVDLARRNMQPLSVLMVDIDHFKSINDRFGHATGDEVLKAVAGALKNSLRNIDMVFRYGGEEFLVLLANTSREAAQMVGERLRLAVLGLQYLEEGRALELSVSLGCATMLPGESPDSLQRRADSALYVSKREGRNRLSMAG